MARMRRTTILKGRAGMGADHRKAARMGQPADEQDEPPSLRTLPAVRIVPAMPERRWVRIIPVALIMYAIAYINRINVSMAQKDMIRDLGMDQEQAGAAIGIFFWGYLLLQIPGGYLASRWSAKKFIAALLILWGGCAVAGGFVEDRSQLALQRFFLGITEGGVFPATLVLLSNWFPRTERARATASWSLCQPLAVGFSSPLTGGLMDALGWRWMLIAEGALPFVWLIVWLLSIDDHPREARWISAEERERIEEALRKETEDLERPERGSFAEVLRPQVLVLVAIYFFLNGGLYGCIFWIRSAVEGREEMASWLVGLLAAVPYVLTVFVMVGVARSSDRRRERRGHVALALGTSGVFLIAGVISSGWSFPLAYFFICIAVPGPFAALGPFWAIPTETLSRRVAGSAMGLINALGCLGGFFGTWLVGYVAQASDIRYGFALLGLSFLAGSGLTALLPASDRKGRPTRRAAEVTADSCPEK
jgi:sugar phosphate permease